MLCPYCLNEITGPKCQTRDCPELPPGYAKAHSRLFSRPPAMFCAIGFSGHGKTVYLASLLHFMNQSLVRVWPDFFRQALDQDSVNTVDHNLKLLDNGELPQSTRLNFPRPSLHLLHKMPDFGSRTWVAYDPPGEAFNSSDGITRWAHFVQNSRAVVFLVSLADLPEPRGREIYKLLEIYALGMKQLKADTRKQHLIVAFTKADRISDAFAAYPTVRRHLNEDSIDALKDPKRYLKLLEQISFDLSQFVSKDLEEQQFLHFTRASFKSVSYCAVSALGSAPDGAKLSTRMNSRCVVDPLIWALAKS